jgi:hypothetical protein
MIKASLQKALWLEVESRDVEGGDSLHVCILTAEKQKCNSFYDVFWNDRDDPGFFCYHAV